MSVWATVRLGYCLVQLMSTVHGLLSGQVTVWLGYFLLGKCPSSYCLLGMCPRGSVHWATVRLGYCLVELMSTVHGLLSSRVTVQSGYCLLGKCPLSYCLLGMCPWGSFHWASVRLGYCPDIYGIYH